MACCGVVVRRVGEENLKGEVLKFEGAGRRHFLAKTQRARGRPDKNTGLSQRARGTQRRENTGAVSRRERGGRRGEE